MNTASMLQSKSIPELGSLLPANIKDEIPNPSIPWLISDELFARLQAVPTKKDIAYRKVAVLPTDPEWRFVWKYFSHDGPNRYMIKSIYCVHHRKRMQTFENQLIDQDRAAKQFPSNWNQESNPELREKVMFLCISIIF